MEVGEAEGLAGTDTVRQFCGKISKFVSNKYFGGKKFQIE